MVAGSWNGVAGFADGVGRAVRFNQPAAVFTHDSKSLIVSDSNNSRIRVVELSSGTVETIAGTGDSFAKDGTGRKAQISDPRYVHV